ncbi:hypothetical protein pb186bvf_015934 [Paramecium bursaria]
MNLKSRIRTLLFRNRNPPKEFQLKIHIAKSTQIIQFNLFNQIQIYSHKLKFQV